MAGWSREDLAWLAGLIEGEGSFCIDTARRYIRVRVSMTDEDVIRKASQAAGLGRVRGPYQIAGGIHKDRWVWEVTDSHEAYALMAALYPWLGRRRRARIREILPLWLAYRATNPRYGPDPGTPWGDKRRRAQEAKAS